MDTGCGDGTRVLDDGRCGEIGDWGLGEGWRGELLFSSKARAAAACETEVWKEGVAELVSCNRS